MCVCVSAQEAVRILRVAIHDKYQPVDTDDNDVYEMVPGKLIM